MNAIRRTSAALSGRGNSVNGGGIDRVASSDAKLADLGYEQGELMVVPGRGYASSLR